MRVSICGCGWLGLPLAKQLVRDGYEVYGSNRDKNRAAQLTEAGIRGIALSLPIEIPEASSDSSSEADGQYCEFFLRPMF